MSAVKSEHIFVVFFLAILNVFLKMKKSSILLFSVSCFIILKLSTTRFLLVKVDKKEISGDQGDVDAEIENLGKFFVISLIVSFF